MQIAEYLAAFISGTKVFALYVLLHVSCTSSETN